MKKAEIQLRKELELFNPVAAFLESQGFSVNGEVHHCDLVAVREEHVLVVELKKILNLEVILQAVDRQKTAEEVYIAVFKDDKLMKTSKYKDLLHLLKRLEIGLMLVSVAQNGDYVEVPLVAETFDRVRSRQQYKKSREALLKEFKGRKTVTAGGISKTKVMTSYKELSIEVALKLESYESASSRELATIDTDAKKIYSVLYKNYHGWFEKSGKGRFRVTDTWLNEKMKYKDVIECLKNK